MHETHPSPGHEVEDHDRGLAFDVTTLLTRRRLLGAIGLGGLATLGVAACGGGTSSSTEAGATTTTAAASTTTAAVAADSPGGPPPGGGGGDAESSVTVAEGEIPEETAGPYPGDGSNGVDVLSQSGIVRSDITTSFGAASGVAAGVPLTFTLTVVDLSDGSAPMAGAAVYAWHCDQDGRYSLYDDAIVEEDYLRGVQEADADGAVTFTSIFPAAYSGRWPHIHFEVYPSVGEATGAGTKLRTSQLALPEDACAEVYATAGYEASVANLARTSLDSDTVFSDGYSLQLATVTGSVADGYTASLAVPV